MADYFLLENAVGTIEAGPDQQQRLDELAGRLARGDYYATASGSIPTQCIDGRPGGTGTTPNAAGGSESLFVAQDLTARQHVGDAVPTANTYAQLLDELVGNGLPIGGHADDHAAGTKSGCGANDRLAEIYAFIAEYGDKLRHLTESLGITVADRSHELIVRNAASRSAFSDGAELLEVLRAKGGDAPVLSGAHKEAVAVINTVAGTTLDRRALATVFGPDYQAFNIDVWSFHDAASALSADGTGSPSRVAAMVYYNLAAAHILCGPAMRVVVRASA